MTRFSGKSAKPATGARLSTPTLAPTGSSPTTGQAIPPPTPSTRLIKNQTPPTAQPRPTATAKLTKNSSPSPTGQAARSTRSGPMRRSGTRSANY